MLLLNQRGGEIESEGERVGLDHQLAQRIGTSGTRVVSRPVSHGLCLLRQDISDFRPPFCAARLRRAKRGEGFDKIERGGLPGAIAPPM